MNPILDRAIAEARTHHTQPPSYLACGDDVVALLAADPAFESVEDRAAQTGGPVTILVGQVGWYQGIPVTLWGGPGHPGVVFDDEDAGDEDDLRFTDRDDPAHPAGSDG